MNIRKLFSFLVSILFCFFLNSQNSYLDSLQKNWKNSSLPDSVRLKSLDDLIWDGYLFSNPDSAIVYCEELYGLSKRLNNKKYQSIACKNRGVAHTNLGEYDKAIVAHKLSLKLSQMIGYKHGESAANGNLGQVYNLKGNYNEALSYYFKALKMGEEMGDKNRVAAQLMNIGTIYQSASNTDKALESYQKALNIYTEINSLQQIAICYSNIGNIYTEQKKYDLAEKVFLKAIRQFEEGKDEHNLSFCFHSIAKVYVTKAQGIVSLKKLSANDFKLKDSLIQLAFDYATMSKKLSEKLNNKSNLASAYSHIGSIYMLKHDFSKAETNFKEALKLAKSVEAAHIMRDQYESLRNLYDSKNDVYKAYDSYKKFISLKDSLLTQSTLQSAYQKELEHDFEKKITAENVRREEEKKVIDAKLQKEKIQRFSLYGGLFITLVFSVFVFNRLKVARKQKQIIEQQKLAVEQQNLEITSSIRYAKRIQAAILPPSSYIDSIFEKYYIIYKPKDIVAGDFYWFEKVDDNVVFAAADCTGHGVPGAMVSVVCNNALNRCVREFGILDPGKILDKAREIIISEFKKSEEELQDGMDISLCVFNVETYKLLWAGANNPLWIIRNGELIELKPDKQPIGKYTHQKKFTTHELQLEKDDLLYVFTDGYQDQFGGKEGKKFKVSNLKKLLLEVSKNNIDKQKSEINAAFESWKAGNVQVDDVCLIGVKV